eukprot:gene7829-13700_t
MKYIVIMTAGLLLASGARIPNESEIGGDIIEKGAKLGVAEIKLGKANDGTSSQEKHEKIVKAGKMLGQKFIESVSINFFMLTEKRQKVQSKQNREEFTKDKRTLWQQIEDKVDLKIGQKLSEYHVERLRNEVFKVLEAFSSLKASAIPTLKSSWTSDIWFSHTTGRSLVVEQVNHFFDPEICLESLGCSSPSKIEKSEISFSFPSACIANGASGKCLHPCDDFGEDYEWCWINRNPDQWSKCTKPELNDCMSITVPLINFPNVLSRQMSSKTHYLIN